LRKITAFIIWIVQRKIGFFLFLRRIRIRFQFIFSLEKLEVFFTAGLLLFVLCWGAFLGIVYYHFNSLKSIKDLDDYSLYEVPTVVYDIKGRKITEFYLYKRNLIRYQEIPETLISTLLTAEDKNFFTHGGVDFLGILRAFITNIQAGAIKQGGSTISQQLAKLLFTTRERTIARKLQELWLTFQIEEKYTKQEILEKYLNKVYYGNNQYGLEAATHFYFGKEAKDLNYAESAFLVSIPPSPTYLNPLRYPMRTKEKQEIILNSLVRENLLTREEADKQFKIFWIDFQQRLISGDFYKSKTESFDEAPYFSEYIRRLMIEKFSESIYTGGYRIYTTLDIDKQKIGQDILNAHLKTLEEGYKEDVKKLYESIKSGNHNKLIEFFGYAFNLDGLDFYKAELEEEAYQNVYDNDLAALDMVYSAFNMTPENLLLENILTAEQGLRLDYRPEGALLSMEIPSGRIITMIGGSGYTPFNQLNRTYQSRRQPGSGFKPFVYLTALMSRRFTPSSLINDIPLIYKIENDELWTPGNAGGNYSGRVRLREALKKSINIVSIRLIEALGIEAVTQVASKILGLPFERFRQDFSLALGTSELTQMELLKGYAVIGNMGKDVFPHAIIRVEDRYGKAIWEPEKEIDAKEKEQLIPKEYAYLITDIMKGVLGPGGTVVGERAKAKFNNYAAGKTGTTSNFKDAWFTGFSPFVASSVWVGFDRGVSLGRQGYSSKIAAPIWLEFMREILKEYPANDFPYQGGLIKVPICSVSGKLPTEYCKEIIDEYFIYGTEPKDSCDICEKDAIATEKEIDKIELFKKP